MNKIITIVAIYGRKEDKMEENKKKEPKKISLGVACVIIATVGVLVDLLICLISKIV